MGSQLPGTSNKAAGGIGHPPPLHPPREPYAWTFPLQAPGSTLEAQASAAFAGGELSRETKSETEVIRSFQEQGSNQMDQDQGQDLTQKEDRKGSLSLCPIQHHDVLSRLRKSYVRHRLNSSGDAIRRDLIKYPPGCKYPNVRYLPNSRIAALHLGTLSPQGR